MSEPDTAWTAVQTAMQDQHLASMASLGGAWAAMYRALYEGGVPQEMARSMVERQQSTACQLMLLAEQGRLGQAR
jgi:hypothetical protein